MEAVNEFLKTYNVSQQTSTQDAPFDADHARGPEEFETISGNAIGGGLFLLFGLAVLGLVLLLGGGSQPGRPVDRLGFSISVKEVASDYKLTWSPRKRLNCAPRPKAGENDDGGSILYTIVWGFLGVWLTMSAIFLILAGCIREIEVFRAQIHLFSAAMVMISLMLCAAWTIVFRLGSFTKQEKAAWRAAVQEGEENEKRVDQLDPEQKDARPHYFANASGQFDDINNKRRIWLWIAAIVLGVAWLLATVAAGSLGAWTLPGEQYGMLLFFGPGYGLYAGWLLFAFSLSGTIAVRAQSFPDGVSSPPKPTTTHGTDNIDHVYPPSYVPVVFCALGALIAIASRDPAQPVPALIALCLFAPIKLKPNIYAAVICGVGIVVAAVLVWLKRSGTWGW
jgi:hypothetical protein